MKKTILALMFVAGGAFALTANAQNTDSNTQQNCKDKTECQAKKCQKNKDGKGRKDDFAARQAEAFKGIILTEAQQNAINEINNQQTAKFAERKEQAKQAKEARKADTANATADNGKQPKGQRPERASREDRKQARLDYFKQIQAVLTPEQYVTFLENTAASAPGMNKDKGNRHGRHNDGKGRHEKDNRDKAKKQRETKN